MTTPIARQVAARFKPGRRVVGTDGTNLHGPVRRGTLEGTVVRHIASANAQGGTVIVDWDNGSRGRHSAGSLALVEPLTWKRHEHGWLRSDGAWFLERGARMSTGGTNAWLIFRRVTADRIGRDASTCYDTRTGDPLWSCPDGLTRPADYTGDLYAHDYDAGSLAEAKATVAQIETKEQTR